MKEKNSGIKRFYEIYGEIIKGIMEKTVLGQFWGKGGSVSCQKQVLNGSRIYRSWYGKKSLFSIPIELFSMASSTYYAASGNAGSRAKASNLFSKVFWYWRAWRCLRAAEKLSDKFAKFKRIEEMSLGELDVRACVLHKSKRLEEARNYLIYGIVKVTKEQTGTKHDLCLFLIHEAEIIAGMRKYDKGNKVEEIYRWVMKLSEDETVPVLTSVRVMKSYGKFLVGVGRTYEAKHLLNRAYFLAEENKLFDQAVKIKALLAGIK